jgi:hypothetical protein
VFSKPNSCNTPDEEDVTIITLLRDKNIEAQRPSNLSKVIQLMIAWLESEPQSTIMTAFMYQNFIFAVA